ncbi:distal tail protein Dit [Bacillus thuringiensis]|uniref:Phage tail protein n=1 Tax=Bacillus thuringiensis TaxID=1428 RepID=A0A9X6Y7L0_BACTU|nr:distal tail protein Dit [Bacillus thuringiensis]PEA86373.1 phage tail protein [Bacillus thuringiensis]
MLDIRIDEFLASDFQLSMVDRPHIPTAKQKIDKIDVPGRNGSLTKKGAYEDVVMKVKFNILEDENIKPLVRRIKVWLLNGKILSFSDDDVFRKVKHVEIDDINNEIEEYGEFDVTFTLDPFEYAEDIEVTIYKPEMIYNSGTIESDPKMLIVGNGTFRITINDVSFQLKDVNGSVVIDSEVLEAYNNTIPMNDKMIGEFPVFKIGENKIEWSGAIQSITIQPRWRYL